MKNQIAIIPMDNRNYTGRDPRILGAMAGWRVLEPDVKIIGNDMASGADAAALEKWLLSVCARVDCVILPLDLFLYGGCIRGTYRIIDERDVLIRLNILGKIRKKNPACRIYGFKIIHGISVHSLIGRGIGEKTAKDLFDHFELCGVDDKKNARRLKSIRKSIPAKVLSEFLEIRESHARVNESLLRLVEGDLLDYLLFAQNDVPRTGLHLIEQKRLARHLRDFQERTGVITGLDESIHLLLARHANFACGVSPRIFIQYSSARGPMTQCKYEDRCLGDNVRNHVFVAGGTAVETPEDANGTLMINCPEDEQGELLLRDDSEWMSNRNAGPFVAAIQWHLGRSKNVALADVFYVNGGDDELMSLLEKNIDLKKLAGYAGWNTAANTVGTAIAQLCVQFAGRRNGAGAGRMKREKERFLLTRLINDWLYQGKVRAGVIRWARKELGVQPWDLGGFKSVVEKRIKKEMKPEMERLVKRHFPGWDSGDIEIELPRTRVSTLNVNVGGNAGD
ncbi:MAG: DUF4127 family protein [Verrucomicrobiae bacterium]|nr:DUF4127 family protein [Verrucomicrobiae bacterium]